MYGFMRQLRVEGNDGLCCDRSVGEMFFRLFQIFWLYGWCHAPENSLCRLRNGIIPLHCPVATRPNVESIPVVPVTVAATVETATVATAAAATVETATVAAAATVETAAAAAAVATIFTGFGFLHYNCPAVEFAAVEFRDCFAGFIVVGHFHKAEALGLAGEFVGDYIGGRHFAISFERLAEVGGLSVETQFCNKNVHYEYELRIKKT